MFNYLSSLRPEQMIIGVPEPLRIVSFDVTIDDNYAELVLNTSIQVSDYFTIYLGAIP